MAVTNVAVQLTHYSFQKQVLPIQNAKISLSAFLSGIPDGFYGLSNRLGGGLVMII
ncbi:hypothetical protein NIES23_11520 [Trichormus variabilis NIES-23]|uniref:Uncharacterized protein n=1 Tax=Trichormus variabilis NIES-23 TaxID=1973479 RepID=A0A1Z4KHA6_ANAVA|nr:hypothetical protein NIES23_11520 [Trichormus variabilis NIES-23]